MLYVPANSIFPITVPFLIDTGAMTSTLHPRDVLSRLGLSPDRLATPEEWDRRSTSVGIGGTAMHLVEPARLEFSRDDRSVRALEQDIEIAQLTDVNDYLPALLGWDVLRHFRLTLDARTGEVLLDE